MVLIFTFVPSSIVK